MTTTTETNRVTSVRASAFRNGCVRARPEAVALALEDDHLDAVVRLGLAHEVADALESGNGKRVRFVGPVERDRGDGPLGVDLVAHVALEHFRVGLHVLGIPLRRKQLGL